MNASSFHAPLIEGRLARSVAMPVFVKALTQGARVVELPSAFASHPDHLERAAEIIREHWLSYRERGLHNPLPLAYYAYIISPGHSYRFSTDGVFIGRFHDHPIVAYVQTKKGKLFTFG